MEPLIDEAESEIQSNRESTARIVQKLVDIEAQRVYLQLGFSSLYELATERFRYTPSAAMRIIKAVRVSAAAPSVVSKLASGELNFETIGVLFPFVKEPVLQELVTRCSGRSKEDAEKIVAPLRPVTMNEMRDRIVPVVVRKSGYSSLFQDGEQNNNPFLAPAQLEMRSCEDFGQRADERFHLSFSASKEVKELLRRARQLMFRGDPDEVTFEKVIGRALTFYLSRHCPMERQRRREERREKAAAKKCIDNTAPSGTSAHRVPMTVRDRVLERDGYQCSFISEDGKRCSCTVDLEIDHILPLGRGGTSADSNLRTLCRAHNLARAREVFGETYIEQKIAEQRNS